MRILVTGAAGRVGQAVRKELAAAGHRLRLVDIRPVKNPEGESQVADITDPSTVRKIMKGIEAVVHLAYGRISGNPADCIVQGYDVNAKATHLLLWAAAEARVKRFIFTSSLSVFGKGDLLLRRKTMDERSVPHPGEPYGFTKLLGEEACRFAARSYGLSVIVLRLCYVRNPTEWKKVRRYRPRSLFQKRGRAMATHVDDVARSIHRALKVRHRGFELFHIAAENSGRITSIRRSQKELGFHPQHRIDR